MSCRIWAGMSKGRTRGHGDARGLPRPGPHRPGFFALLSTARRAVSGVRALSANGLARPIAPGRSPHRVKVKNPKAPAVKREAEEDWGK
jgi:hypothetical protein